MSIYQDEYLYHLYSQFTKEQIEILFNLRKEAKKYIQYFSYFELEQLYDYEEYALLIAKHKNEDIFNALVNHWENAINYGIKLEKK